MRFPTPLDPQAVALAPEAFKATLENGLRNGYDTRIWGWGSEVAKHIPEFRAHYDLVTWKECSTAGKSLEGLMAGAQRNFAKRCTPPLVSGLPRSRKEWKEATEGLTAIFAAGLLAGVSVELQALLPESRARAYVSNKEAKVAESATFYHIDWDESHGGDSIRWLEINGDSLLGVLRKAAKATQPTLARMERAQRKEEKRQSAFRARHPGILVPPC